MKKIIVYIISILPLFSCVFDNSDDSNKVLKVYACNQNSGYITVLDAIGMTPIDTVYSHLSNGGLLEDTNCSIYSSMDDCKQNNCMWMGDHCMEYGNEDPHHIVIDEDLDLWFNTVIMSGYVGMYSLTADTLISSIFVGDQPAIMAINSSSNKLYISRMMPMVMDNGMSMGSQNSLIQEISYNQTDMEKTNEFNIQSPSPHAITLSSDGRYIYTISNTADWIYKIDTENGSLDKVSMEGLSEIPSLETNRLKPIFCSLSEDKYLFISCQGGQYLAGSENQFLKSRVQMWDTEDLELIDEYLFTVYSSAWHTVVNEESASVYITLSGETGGSGLDAGVVSLGYTEEGLLLNWTSTNDLFSMPHGIILLSEGLLVSDRGNGNLYKLDIDTGTIIELINLDSRFVTGVAGMTYKVDLYETTTNSNQHHHHH
mgnify:CR=1 FL=1